MLAAQRSAYDAVVKAFTDRRAEGKGKAATKNVRKANTISPDRLPSQPSPLLCYSCA